MAVTKEQLRELGVSLAFGTQDGLLPFLSLDIEELRIINDAVGAPNEAVGHIWDKELSVDIGKGVTYHVDYQGKYGSVDVWLTSKADCFIYPVQLKVIKSHEPDSPDEHSEWCPYHQTVWERDDTGDEYWVNDAGEPEYEPECYCEYVTDSVWEYEVSKDEATLDKLVEYLQGVGAL
jgi:hypothetical protein